MEIHEIEFDKLEKEISKTSRSLLDYLAPNIGKVYVVAITRDECPACEKQKPKLEKLATTLTEKYGNRVVFARIRVKRPFGLDKESLRSKDLLGHYFYPTNLILLRTRDRGAIELYRNIEPKMNELKKNIGVAVEITKMIK